MMREGKNWHIDDDGILFIGKGVKRGKGFLPWFNDRESITGLGFESFANCTSLSSFRIPTLRIIPG